MDRSRFGRWAWPWLVIVAVGTTLRCWQLSGQILADDEWHAVRTAIGETYLQIVTGFSVSAAPTLALLYRACYDTVGLSELVLRLPMMIAGLVMLVAFPAMLPPASMAGVHASSRLVRLTFGAALAISPLLIYFSRYARPYALSLAFTFVGVMAFYRWWLGESRRFGALYVCCAILGPAFHLTAASSLLAPLGFAWLGTILERRDPRPGMRSAMAIVGLGSMVGLGLMLVVGAPVILDFGALSTRAGASQTDWLTIRESLPLLAGGQGPILLLMCAAAIVGSLVMARQSARFAGYLAWVSVATAAGTWISGADSVQVPIVYLRYSLFLVPVFLLMAAVGGARLLVLLPTPAWRGVAGTILAATIYGFGPLPQQLHRVNNWPHHAIFQYTYRDDSPFSYERRPAATPDFYRQLAQRPPGSVRLAETPFYYEWHNNVLPYYQELHQQQVVAGILGGVCRPKGAVNAIPGDPGRMHLRTLARVDAVTELIAQRIDYVVLHLEPRSEIPGFRRDGMRVPGTNIPAAAGADGCLVALGALFGDAVYQDATLAVYAVPAAPLEQPATPAPPRRRGPPEPISADGFESGDLSGWSTSLGSPEAAAR